MNDVKHTPQIGDFVKPDGWKIGELLSASDGFKDSSFAGCDFRLESPNASHAVNITVTGLPRYSTAMRYMNKSRCRIEFVGDGEPSTFSGGWIHHNF